MLLARFLPLTTLIASVLSNPSVYGICQARCANDLVACYAAGGSTFGAISTAADVIPEQMVCNADYSNCQVDCIDTFIDWAKAELDKKAGPTRTTDCLVVQE